MLVGRFTARALGEISDARAVEPLITALFDPDDDVRVREALRKMHVSRV